MLRRVAVTLAVVIAGTLYLMATANSAAVVSERCSIAAFRPFTAAVWHADWRRGAPKPATLQAKWERVGCASPGGARAMRYIWNVARGRYYAHRSHCLSGPVFVGRISEFSGGRTADGIHFATEPGIALRSYATLGETFRLRTSAGVDYVTQTDWGPADWTGRTIDITTAQMRVMGWAPTDSQGEAKLIPSDCAV